MKTIILDTNFLLLPFSHGVDIYAQIDRIMSESYQFVVSQAILDELDKLITAGQQTGKDAKAAKQLLQQKRETRDVTVLPSTEYVDDWIVDYTTEHADTLVATQDTELKKRLIVPVIVLSQKNHITIIEK